MKKVYVINGPNLNLTGSRQPEVYGGETLSEIEKDICDKAAKLDIECICFQTNHEGEIIDLIHKANVDANAIILNAGAYSHYSYAIRDAVIGVDIPTVEVHISNIYARDEFRHTSVLSAVCKGVICGFGKDSYLLALGAISAF